MQIFSRQSAMMDALISHFAEQMRARREGTDGVAADNVVDDGKLDLLCSLTELNVNSISAFDCRTESNPVQREHCAQQ